MKVKNRKIHVVGINSFEFEELSSNIKVLIQNINDIAIHESYFNQINIWFKNSEKDSKNLYSCKSNIDLIKWLEKNLGDVLLLSRGDPLWFGIGRILLDHFPKEELHFYPSLTCVQLAFNKLKKPWNDIKCISIHGRESDLCIKALKSRTANIAIIPDPNCKSIELIRKNLLELQLEDYYDFWICEYLGYKNEKIRELKTEEAIPKDIGNLYIIILSKKESIKYKKDYPLFGINDSVYKTFKDRPNLLTKKEIRVQILSDLELPEKGIIWDIGSGSGSIGLEAIRLRPKLKLFSIDKRFGTKKLILENSKRLNVSPFKIYESDIHELIKAELNKSLKPPNRVIIGGCKEETKIFIIKNVSQFMKVGDIFVLPIVTLEVLKEIKSIFEELKFQININLIHIQKGVSISEGTRFEPSNPIFLIKGKK
tara:strand:- start:403 stop:1677 length:1275 start_codon:yes stop_codon:yes gene_type:complete